MPRRKQCAPCTTPCMSTAACCPPVPPHGSVLFTATLPAPGGVPVAVILFPPLSAGGTPETEAPTPKLLASVLAAADAASDAAIRIGISPWGFEGEFAVREALEQRYHLLLGGGPGAAFAGEVNAQAPGLIWSRADKDGRSVMAIDIMALPEPGVPFAWEWGLSMQAQEVRLTSAVPSNPHMEALAAGKAAR